MRMGSELLLAALKIIEYFWEEWAIGADHFFAVYLTKHVLLPVVEGLTRFTCLAGVVSEHHAGFNGNLRTTARQLLGNQSRYAWR